MPKTKKNAMFHVKQMPTSGKTKLVGKVND